MKTIFTQGPSLLIQLILVLITCSSMMVLDYRYQYLNSVRSTFSTLASPVYYLANLPSEISVWADDNIVSRADLIDENQNLKDQLMILKAQNQRLVGLESDNAQLRKLLNSSRKLKGKRLIAEIINVNTNNYAQEIMVNKGSSDGLYVGQSAVDSDGVMGQVIEVTLFWSRIILINDPNHAIPVKNNRNGIRAIARGNGINLNVMHLPSTIDIKQGDLLLSSGLGEKFPDGYPVAKVVSVTKNSDQPYLEVIAEPTANINTADHVLLLWETATQELEATNER
ncbi:rod shape-determining protein MreC [Kangiella sp. HZ709]|uniref:rod shape-determining protein MreC n=1 Tax=Kangiella sp. HZ709 TaxID=2666328 RepID=UPI00351B3AC4